MKAIETDGKGQVRIVEVPRPVPGAGQCLCRITACATCSGTDRKLVHGALPWADTYPALLGHESVGTVVECGPGVQSLAVGDRVLRPCVAYPGTRHGTLASWMGGFAEYGIVTDPAARTLTAEEDPFGYARYQQRLPREAAVSDADATMLIMLKEVAGSTVGAGIGSGHRVLVLGAGGVARAMCFFSKLLGASQVIAAARRDAPLQACRKCGADALVNTSRQILTEEVQRLTGGHGVDFVMDAAGNVELALEAATLLADGGVLASYATLDGGGQFPRELVRARGTWRMLETAVGEDAMHERMLAWVADSRIPFANFYSHLMPFQNFTEGFRMLEERQADKIVFAMPGEDS